MLVAMLSPSSCSAGLVKSKNTESLCSAVSSKPFSLRVWKLKSRLRTKSAVGMTWLLMMPRVRLVSQSEIVSLATATTSSAASTRSAVPVTMREQVTSAG
ncbi:hypothetical protein ACVWZ3_004666 [Bradyrhizobium sp. i1.3.6]